MQVKSLIEKNRPCAKLIKSKYSNQPEQIYREEAQRQTLHNLSKKQKQNINLN